MISEVSGCGMIAQWSEHWCTKPEALVRSPVALPKFFPFLRASLSAFFLRLVCWSGLIDVFTQSGPALSCVTSAASRFFFISVFFISVIIRTAMKVMINLTKVFTGLTKVLEDFFLIYFKIN